MFARIASFLPGLMVLPTAALAAEAETRAIANAYSIMLERQLFSWRIWTTGVSRLDDGSLFGLVSIMLVMAFGVSGLGIILFKDRGLGFRGGWLLSLPVIVGTLVVYTVVRPYPGAREVPSMLLMAGLAALIALLLARLLKGSMSEPVDRPARKAELDRAAEERRLRMAVRAPGSGKRGW
ncbi:MAG: hypothetical protein V9G24_07420 [Rhodoblastus sp.]|jgi:hypothetical protein